MKNEAWVQSPIDRFILAKLEEKGIAAGRSGVEADAAAARDLRSDRPAAHAARDRRISWPTTPRTLTPRWSTACSPRRSTARRWGRHWLDVARYADSTGMDEDHIYPYAWRYRDYVVKAFNDDLPYDRFVTEQTRRRSAAADKPARNERGIVATGFLALGPKPLAQQDRMQDDLRRGGRADRHRRRKRSWA